MAEKNNRKEEWPRLKQQFKKLLRRSDSKQKYDVQTNHQTESSNGTKPRNVSVTDIPEYNVGNGTKTQQQTNVSMSSIHPQMSRHASEAQLPIQQQMGNTNFPESSLYERDPRCSQFTFSPQDLQQHRTIRQGSQSDNKPISHSREVSFLEQPITPNQPSPNFTIQNRPSIASFGGQSTASQSSSSYLQMQASDSSASRSNLGLAHPSRHSSGASAVLPHQSFARSASNVWETEHATYVEVWPQQSLTNLNTSQNYIGLPYRHINTATLLDRRSTGDSRELRMCQPYHLIQTRSMSQPNPVQYIQVVSPGDNLQAVPTYEQGKGLVIVFSQEPKSKKKKKERKGNQEDLEALTKTFKFLYGEDFEIRNEMNKTKDEMMNILKELHDDNWAEQNHDNDFKYLMVIIMAHGGSKKGTCFYFQHILILILHTIAEIFWPIVTSS